MPVAASALWSRRRTSRDEPGAAPYLVITTVFVVGGRLLPTCSSKYPTLYVNEEMTLEEVQFEVGWIVSLHVAKLAQTAMHVSRRAPALGHNKRQA